MPSSPPRQEETLLPLHYIIQLSPHGEANSGHYIPRREAEGDNYLSIYQIRWIKMKTVTFCKSKTSLRRNFIQFTNLLRILSSAFLRFCCKFSMKIIFYLPLNTDKPTELKKNRFLGICLYDCFVYRANVVFRKCLEARRHLGSDRKTCSE